MDGSDWDDLQRTLDRLHQWPGLYTFKFVVPTIHLGRTLEALNNRPFATRYSRSGRYVSLSATLRMDSSAEVVAIYRSLEGIPGLVSL